jgi:hypothetical protein
LFQTAFGSGAAAGFPPFASDENRGDEVPVPLPDFATNRGRDTDRVAEPVGGVLEPAAGLSLVLDETLGFALEARNVLLTETALKVVGFLAEEPVRLMPFSPSFARDASVSDPPLTLTSAELIWSSTFVMRLFAMSSGSGVPPFIAGASNSPCRESDACEPINIRLAQLI